jgi:hypothetical protein
MLMRLALVTMAATIPACAPLSESVPFVGCPADGQAGPFEPPEGASRTVALPAALAEQIAFYEGTYSPGVFAPRGWQCKVLYGSSGSILLVTPAASDPSWTSRSELPGQAVQVETVVGDGSGRFRVAAYGSYLFPKAAAKFVEAVTDMDPEIANDAVAALPRATDAVFPVASTVARFTTPASAKGLGTDCGLAPTGDPIHGIAVLDTSDGMGLAVLRVRLASNLHGVEAAILALNEECLQSRDGC